MKKAVIYYRVSDPDQVKGPSLDAQREKCASWAREHDYQIVGTYKDEAKSGTKTAGRDGLIELINRCKSEHIDIALTIDTDRMARDEFDHFFIRKELGKVGTPFFSVNQPMIDDSPEGKLLDGMLASINAFYSRLTGRKVKNSLQKRFNDGWWPGPARLGYINENIGSKDKPNRIIKNDPIKRPLITELFWLFSTNRYSVDELVEIMFDKGLKSKNNKKVCRSILYNTLTNIFYIGMMAYKGQVKKGNHEPLTTPEIFKTCQEIIKRNNHNACRRRKYKWLLSGLVYCHDCGTRFYCSWQHKKNKCYYHGNIRNGCKHYIPLEEMEENVAQEFKKIKFSPEFIQQILYKAKELVKNTRDNRETEIKGLRNAIKQLENKRIVLEDSLMDQTIDKTSFTRRHNELNIKIENLENDVANINSQRGFDVDIVTEIFKLTEGIYPIYEKAGFEAKRHYLSMFFQRLEVKDKQIAKVIYAPLFNKLLEAQKAYRVRNTWLRGQDSNL